MLSLINFKNINPTQDKQPEYIFRGFKKLIKHGSWEYFNISNKRLDLIMDGFKHDPEYFDVMVKEGEKYLIQENGKTKKIGF